MVVEYVKENVRTRPPVPALAVLCGVASAAVSLYVATLVDRALPPPLLRHHAPPDRFIAENAYEHLVNLTNIGPRVAGTYENEVAAVAVLVAAVKQIARAASPHNIVDIDLQRASGGFSLSFFDGMNNIYSDVQNVVVRARSVGGRPSKRTALLLNCHYDSVPDSPGASDDAAGCAVGLETLRALVAAPKPLRHDVILLLNGAEENIMQASHAFITQHKWAGSVRAFINMEACGAGGREVMFQAGPHDPWIVEVYAGAVPHPFASSLAQEMFQSGLIPADTDFRIFRDFGGLSGVDLAWSSDGYVYHTWLDAADRVPLAALQRTGDNVLALATGLLSSESLESQVDRSGGQPVFFDLMGVLVISARPYAAVAAAILTCCLVILRLHISATAACEQLYMRRGEWTRAVWGAALRVAGAGLAGAGAGGVAGAALRIGGAGVAYYARPALLAPLVAAPALAAAALVLSVFDIPSLPVHARRGWWAARATADALAAVAAVLLACCLIFRLRSGYVPLLWALLPTLADLLATAFSANGRTRTWWWVGGWALVQLQGVYVARDSLAMLLPLCGRAGTPPLPIDVVMACAVALITLMVCNWLAALAVAARDLKYIVWAGLGCGLMCIIWAIIWGADGTYSETRPQRLMMFHIRRHLHLPGKETEHLDYYWVPELDPNTENALRALSLDWTSGVDAGWVYGGAPYSLPVLGLISRALLVPALAPPPDHAALHLNYTMQHLGSGLYHLHLQIQGPSHVVVIVSPGAGGVVEWCDALDSAPVEGAPFGRRRTYFLAMHAARGGLRELKLKLRLPMKGVDDAGNEWPAEEWEELCQLSVTGHAMGGPRAPAHEALFNSAPPNIAPTGWPAQLHLYRLLRPH